MYSLDNEGPIQFIQITDTHLLETEQGHLLGLETQYSLDCVLKTVQSENSDIDFFVVSGDLSQDGSLSSYQRLKDSLAPFKVPSFWFAGNHDDAWRGYHPHFRPGYLIPRNAWQRPAM